MKATEKRQLLLSALSGNSTALEQLKRERLKATMPFIDTIGILLIDNCPQELLSISVVDDESIIESRPVFQPLHEFIGRWQQKPFCERAFSLLDPLDGQYDSVLLSAIQIRHKDYSNAYMPNGTIGDLRQLFARSQAYFATYPLLPIRIETNAACFDWDVYNRKHA